MIHYGSITGKTKAARLLHMLQVAGLWQPVNAFRLADDVGTLALHSVAAEIRPQIKQYNLTVDNYVQKWTDSQGETHSRSYYFLRELHPALCVG